MSKSILQNFQTKKETDNLKDRPAPHCGESPIPASSLPAVAVLRPSLLGMMRMMMMMLIMMMCLIMALAQIPISTFSHIWVFVCQYGIMFVIIVIAIIIIIIYRKVKVSTLKHV